MPMELKQKHIVLPYCLGIAWIISHPIISIVTGELKCRGIFTDEHQLDPRSYTTGNYPLRNKNAFGKQKIVFDSVFHESHASNLCRVLEILQEKTKDSYQPEDDKHEDKDGFIANPFFSPYISCHETDLYATVKMLPSQAPTDPTEALVLALPYTEHWLESDLHSTILTMVERVHNAPWLTRTVFIVSPTNNTVPLEVALDTFIGQYTRTRSGTGSVLMSSIPSSYKKYLIRQVIVLDAEASEAFNKNQIVQILPQGRVGIVPNLDLLSATRFSLHRTIKQNSGIRLQMHPFDMTWWNRVIKKRLPADKWWRTYGEDLGGMVAFMTASLLDMLSRNHIQHTTIAPHASALREGIDAITIRAKLKPSGDRRYANRDIVAMVQGVEHLLRGLSNLNERLHHNVNQYIMPSPVKFVSHGEYILPAILLLLPLALRVIVITFQLLQCFQFEKAFKCIGGAFVVSMTVLCLNSNMQLQADLSRQSVFILTGIIYIATLQYVTKSQQKRPQRHESQYLHFVIERMNDSRSIQSLTCLMALYMHIPIALSNISLAIPSAILWVPMFSFPDYGNRGLLMYFAGTFLLISLFLEQRFLAQSMYTSAVFAPLHFLLACLCKG